MHVDDFAEFYREIHGWSPFPWQQDLVREIVERESWPALVDVPTGLGKTSMLDVAVYLTALAVDDPQICSLGRRRVFFVVDRRIVVDQAELHANQITMGIANASPGGAAYEVATRLRKLVGPSSSNQLVSVVKMRGGVTWDASWLARPDELAIITGTVDQVGSREFFRGYGTSPRRQPIDAALTGTDSLILVDEAHLAEALVTTLSSAQSYDSPQMPLPLPSSSVVQLTATARERDSGWTAEFDIEEHVANQVANQRLSAAKQLEIVTTAKKAAASSLTSVAVSKAQDTNARVLVVCNTIDRAREVHTQLKKQLPASTTCLLLIGRTRQYDREPIVEKVLELFNADRAQIAGEAVLVATQTVEVGVDLDATDLVTESASWDALIQRIGRVNRRGARKTSSVTIIQDDDPKPPVYGEASIKCADFLWDLITESGASLDVSPLALRHMAPPKEAFTSRPTVPLLLPAHLDAWTRTMPAPVNDAPLDPYLHGIDRGVAPVSLAWRDGLIDSEQTKVANAEAHQALDSVPLRSEECVDVPLAAVRRWLIGDKPVPVSDWDDDDDWDIPFGDEPSASVLRREPGIDGTSSWQWISPAALRPGDLVVVPAEMGGLDRYGWCPTSTERVNDIAELAALERSRPILRLDPGLPDRLGLPEPCPDLWVQVQNWRSTDDPDARRELEAVCVDRVLSWLRTATPAAHGLWARADRLSRLHSALSEATMQRPADLKQQETIERQFLLPIAILRPRYSSVPWQEASDETADGTVHLAQRVALETHCSAVAARAKEISEYLGLPAELIKVVTAAAQWHDLGKVDPRFQAMLFDGDPVRAAIAPEPLAKSGMPPGDLQRQRDARRRSRLPRRVRHESWSVALVSEYLSKHADSRTGDTELLLHLIASHHGHSRPLLPPVIDDADHQLIASVDGTQVVAELPRFVDLNHADIFHGLNVKYGRWGLALLESIVRCADTTVSGEGS